MYTYETFLSDGVFTLLRPVFFTLLLVSIILLLLILYPRTRQRMLNTFSVISLSAIFGIITVQVIYYDAIIVDELSFGGDPTSTTTALAVMVFTIINPILFFALKSKG
ncbi:hypothetical protein [Mesobacillus subterraneus]|uniref:Uncharacterized protein n=1 Tax=Mesobacillus subterraneus TaxID=285983 RepID=A0A3R9F472_9BACI|nr:hypothetical protein [Mesobacillus subterraneus]RSD28663.1 hypothetical protein EJA10_03550 [Mesobacillus subterraneus]